MFRKRFIILLLFALFSFALCSCQGGTGEEEAHKGDEIQLYYLNAEEDAYVVRSYTLANVDNPEKETLEVLGLLADRGDDDAEKYRIVIPDEVAVNSVKVKKGNATIDFGTGYQQLDEITEALMRIGVVRSVCQIDGVDSVTFTVNGDPVKGDDGETIKNMTADQMILPDEFSSIYTQKKKVVLYYADPKGQKLVAHKQTITAKDNMPIAECIITALKKAPKGQDRMISPLPEGLVINQTQVVENICYIDLSSEIYNLVPEVEEEVTVYSMVNSIASLDDTYQVQFTVDGERVRNINGFDSFDRPLSENRKLVK